MTSARARVSVELGRANDNDLAFVQRHPSTSLMQAEVIHALAELQHTRLGLQNPYSFTMTNVMQVRASRGCCTGLSRGMLSCAQLPFPWGVQGWRACPHAQPGCPTRGAPPAATRQQLHLLTG